MNCSHDWPKLRAKCCPMFSCLATPDNTGNCYRLPLFENVVDGKQTVLTSMHPLVAFMLGPQKEQLGLLKTGYFSRPMNLWFELAAQAYPWTLYTGLGNCYTRGARQSPKWQLVCPFFTLFCPYKVFFQQRNCRVRGSVTQKLAKNRWFFQFLKMEHRPATSFAIM